MAGDHLVLAKQAAFAMAHAIYGLPGCQVRVAAYCTDGYQTLITEQERPRFGRINGMRARGFTPTYAAMLQSAVQLARVKRADRYLMLVITDGSPDPIIDQGVQRSGPEAVRGLADWLASVDVEVVGIGMGYDLSQQYAHALVVHTIDDLVPNALRVLSQRLVARVGLARAGCRV